MNLVIYTSTLCLICCFCLFFFALTEGGLIDLKAYGQIPDTTSPIFSDSPPPPPTSYLPLSHFDHYESTDISTSPVLPAETIQPVATENEIEVAPVQVLESSVDDEGRKHDVDVELKDQIQHDIRPDFDELDKMHALISEPFMTESSEFEQIEQSYEMVESADIPEDVDMKTDVAEPLVDVDDGRADEPEEMLVSTENVEQILEQTPPIEIEEVMDQAQQDADVAAQLEELHRLKSSSYEDIYSKTDFVPEKPGPPPAKVDVGDRFDTKQEEDFVWAF